MEDNGVESLLAQNTPVKSTLSEGAPGLSTPQERDSQAIGESNGDHKTDKPGDIWTGSVTPKVTKTYGKKNKSRARDRTNVSTSKPSTSRLPRTHSSAALRGEIPKETPISKSTRKKRNRSPSPAAPKPAKHHRTPSAPVKGSNSTSNSREVKRPRKPTVHRTSTEPTKKQSTVEYTLHLDSDLSDIDTSLSRSRTPKSDVEITKGPTPPPPSFPFQGTSKSTGSMSRLTKVHPPKFRSKQSGSSNRLTALVWVLIDAKTDRASENGQDMIWWPGKILSKDLSDDPLKVQLLNRKSILVSSPNQEKILSWLDSNDKQRFKEPTFHNPKVESPRRKFKGEGSGQDNLERSWWAAVGKTGEDAEDSDELPDVQDMFTRTSTASISISSRAMSEDIIIDPIPSTTQEVWEDPGPDTSLGIPGELVFARNKDALRGKDAAMTVEHWAAKILEYIPSTKRNKLGMYKVLWMTGEMQNLKRNWFYDMGQPEFFTCKLGQIDSSGGAAQEADISECDPLQRSLSPEPAPDPPTGAKFLVLSLRQQFAYVKPILSSILKNEYPPLKEVQAEYFSGAKTRNWTEHGSRRGSMTDDHVETLLVYMTEWVLRPKHGNRVAREETATPLPKQELPENSKAEIVAQVEEVKVMKDVDENMDKLEDGPSEPLAQPLEQISEIKVTEERDGKMDNIQDGPSELSAQLSARADATVGRKDSAEPELNDGSRSSSPPMTEAMSSPGPLPPSSSFISIAESNDSFVLDPTERDEVNDTMSIEPLEVPESSLTKIVATIEATSEETSNLMMVDDNTKIFSTPPVASFDGAQQLQHDEPLPVPRPTVPRQYGSVEYESLHPRKKILYISDVLLVELVRQILLWRAAERTSSELLDPEEEQKLFDLGEPLLEADWVEHLMRMRMSRTGDNLDSTSTKGGGRFRARKPVNYREKK
ncbi:hypothetical protein CPB83DRAFT_846531 [Crepidotus variabilis]|uniref:Uncharacterized protein n=1 Tax=Crepidotus variabilis TaxID=179855 RepID=A0A9P6JT98_9AGAR|nr:hypothetical protein CPB83DRAFT_846531 [Crepidotus variabilis]